MILHGIEYQRPTSLNMRILADHVTYSFLAFMKSIFHFCLGCYCGGYSQNGRSNLSSFAWHGLSFNSMTNRKIKIYLVAPITPQHHPHSTQPTYTHHAPLTTRHRSPLLRKEHHLTCRGRDKRRQTFDKYLQIHILLRKLINCHIVLACWL